MKSVSINPGKEVLIRANFIAIILFFAFLMLTYSIKPDLLDIKFIATSTLTMLVAIIGMNASLISLYIKKIKISLQYTNELWKIILYFKVVNKSNKLIAINSISTDSPFLIDLPKKIIIKNDNKVSGFTVQMLPKKDPERHGNDYISSRYFNLKLSYTFDASNKTYHINFSIENPFIRKPAWKNRLINKVRGK